jgi:hypothetical protein
MDMNRCKKVSLTVTAELNAAEFESSLLITEEYMKHPEGQVPETLRGAIGMGVYRAVCRFLDDCNPFSHEDFAKSNKVRAVCPGMNELFYSVTLVDHGVEYTYTVFFVLT